MKMNNSSKSKKMQTRAELINRSRSSAVLDSLPPRTKGMFDELREFKQGARQFIDFSNLKP